MALVVYWQNARVRAGETSSILVKCLQFYARDGGIIRVEMGIFYLKTIKARVDAKNRLSASAQSGILCFSHLLCGWLRMRLDGDIATKG